MAATDLNPTTGLRHAPDPHRWKALAVGLTAAFMTLLDVTIVNVALPSIRVGLHASDRQLQWIITGYSLMFGLVLVPAGRLGDARGRRRMFVIGVAAFTVSSAAAGTATTGTFLLIARLVQGVSGGLLTPQVSGLIQQMFHGSERGRAFGLLAGVISLSTAIGPLIGGALIAVFGTVDGWRWVFYVNLPIGAAAITLASRIIPASLGKRRHESLDPVGVLLLGTGVALILLPLIEDRHWWLSLVAASVLGLFVAWEISYGRDHTALVNLTLFRRRTYGFGFSISTTYSMAFTPLFFLFAVYLQDGLHYSALRAGLGVTPFAIGSTASAVLGTRISVRFGRVLVLYGLIVVIIGLAASIPVVSWSSMSGAGAMTAITWLVTGAGSGLVVAPNQTVTLSEVPVEGAGSGGAVVQTGQRVGASFGLAVISAAFFGGGTAGDRQSIQGYEHATLICIGFVIVTLAVAATDVLLSRGRARGDSHVPA